MRIATILVGVLFVVACHGWDYKKGGSDWPSQCKATYQSPIDITNPVGVGGADSESLDAHYPIVNSWDAGLKVVHNGATLQVLAQHRDLGAVVYMGDKYWVREVHFRAPSEHRLRGKQYPMEIQIIHQRNGALGDEGLFAVSALYDMKVNSTRPSSNHLDGLLNWAHLPKSKGQQTLLTGHFQLGLLVDGVNNGYFQYKGSLTAPPCSPGVIWNVLETIQEANPAQILAINQIFKGNFAWGKGHGNNRDVQPGNSRIVTLHNHKPFGDADNNPLPTSSSQSEKSAPPPAYHQLAPAPEDIPVAKHKKPLPNRPSTLPELYQHHGKDWSGYCRYGRTQSPIDIKPFSGNPHGDYEVRLNYRAAAPTDHRMTHVGYGLQALGNWGNLSIVGDKDKTPFKAYEILFHVPAEHTVDGRRAAMELEIYHRRTAEDGGEEFAIVSVLFHESILMRSEFINALSWNYLPKVKGDYVDLQGALNLNDLKGLPPRGGYYSYVGSLSRPPCTQGVRRFVVRTYNEVSTFQMKQIRAIFNGNYRDIQPSNERGVQVQNVYEAQDVLPKYDMPFKAT